MVPITIAVGASDVVDAEPVCSVTSVSSNEPVSGTGQGDTGPDWTVTGALNLNLRAERAGHGSGRVYTIAIVCADQAGNTSTTSVRVTVPHDKGKAHGKGNAHEKKNEDEQRKEHEKEEK